LEAEEDVTAAVDRQSSRKEQQHLAMKLFSATRDIHSTASCPARPCQQRGKTAALFASVSLCLLPLFHGVAQETGKDAPDKAASTPSNSTEKPVPPPAELEATFKATLTKATLSGRWCGIKNGQLGPEKEDKYTILDVTKLGGDVWIVKSRIQYGKNDIVAPIPVRVKWAGDTPVITVDGVSMPGGGTAYSARVLIYGKTYAGTWSGGNHAGLMSGVITNEKDEKPSAPASKPE
jgi:hypothetical protein